MRTVTSSRLEEWARSFAKAGAVVVVIGMLVSLNRMVDVGVVKTRPSGMRR